MTKYIDQSHWLPEWSKPAPQPQNNFDAKFQNPKSKLQLILEFCPQDLQTVEKSEKALFNALFHPHQNSLYLFTYL